MSNYRYNLKDSMLGRQIPMFTNNLKPTSNYYLYQLVSPSLSPSQIPYFGLTKISERLWQGSELSGHENDVISVILGKKVPVSDKLSHELICDIMSKEDVEIDMPKDRYGFPLIEMGRTNNPQKLFIISLRDKLRWKTYRFVPGAFVDVLWGPDTYVVYPIVGTDSEISLGDPIGHYKTSDPEMKEPLDIPAEAMKYPKDKFSGKTKISAFNWMIKRLEWNSFDR